MYKDSEKCWYNIHADKPTSQEIGFYVGDVSYVHSRDNLFKKWHIVQTVTLVATRPSQIFSLSVTFVALKQVKQATGRATKCGW